MEVVWLDTALHSRRLLVGGTNYQIIYRVGSEVEILLIAYNRRQL